ncbi:MAG: outer membrane beta-barrel protein [Rhodothermales bacterium]
MNKMSVLVLLMGVFAVAGMQDARAQTQIDFGPRIGFDIGGDLEEFFIGADGRVGVASLPVLFNGTFDFYFVDNVDIFQFSINALYEFGISNEAFTPYVGGGIGISRISTDDDFGIFDRSTTDTGLNLIGGATFGFGNLKPFAQAQITFGDLDLFTVGGGLLFNLSR